MNQLVLIALRRPYTVVMYSYRVFPRDKTIRHMPTQRLQMREVPPTSVVWIYSGIIPPQVEGRITYMFERFLTSTVEGIRVYP